MATPFHPPPNATPAAIRSYFSTILQDLHAVSETEAQEISSKWRFGRGSELSYYDLTTYREIFGVEAGTILFGHARRELGTNRNGPSQGLGKERNTVELPKKDIFGLVPGESLIHIFLIGAAVSIFLAAVTADSNKAGVYFFVGMICMFGFVLSYASHYFHIFMQN